jgi:hypothetical protein
MEQQSDDEDPLALVPRSRPKPRWRGQGTIPTEQSTSGDVVPTSDGEEAVEERISRDGWESYFKSTTSDFSADLRAAELQRADLSLGVSPGECLFVPLDQQRI